MIDIDAVNENIKELENHQVTMLDAIKVWKNKQSEVQDKGYKLETSHKDM